MNRHPQYRFLPAVGVVALAAMLAGCPFDKPQEHLARGKALAAKGDHTGATIEFKNVLQSDPKSSEARYLLGRELLQTGEARAAEIELQKAYAAKYNRDAVIAPLVQSQLSQNQPEKIPAEAYRMELATPEGNAELRSLLGAASLLQNRPDEALTFYRSAMQAVPDYPQARLGEARIAAIRGNTDEASAEVTAVLAKNPTLFEGLFLKGDIARARGANPEAIAAYVAAIAQSPRSVAARLALADAYVNAKSYDLAQAQVDQLKKLAPRNPGTNYLDALIAFDRKDYLRANDAINLSLGENPANGVGQLLSGAISIAMGQPALGEVHLLEGIRLLPNAIYGRRMLTALYLRQRQPQKANEILQPALRALPDDANLNGMAGEVALLLGDFPHASKYFERTAQIDPANTNAKVRRAAIDIAQGNDAGGLAALEAAAKESANNPNPDIVIIVTQLNRKQYDQALVAWKRLEKNQPDNPLTYNLRAAIDLGRNDRAGARKALEHAVQIQPTFFPAVNNLAGLDELDGNLDAARQRYKTLLAKDKNSSPALVALAQLEANHGAGADVVVPLLTEAHRVAPKSEQPITALVGYQLSQNNRQQALAAVQEGLNATPNNETYLNIVGALQMQGGGVDQAIAAYRTLSSGRPDSVEYKVRLAQAMLLANQGDLAIPALDNILKAQVEVPAVQTAVVGVVLSAGRVDDAARMLATIHKAAPKSPALNELDADVKVAQKQYVEAAALYRKALAQTPSPATTIKLASTLQAAGNDAEAHTLLADWMKAHPKDSAVAVFDADVALRAKDYPRAATAYRAILAQSPNDANVLNNLAWALWQQKDPQAVTFAEKATTLAPNNPAFSDTLGWMLVEQGDTKRGRELLEKASAAAPRQRDITLHLAKAQIKDGQKDRARTTLQALLKAAPDSPEAKESKALMATL